MDWDHHQHERNDGPLMKESKSVIWDAVKSITIHCGAHQMNGEDYIEMEITFSFYSLFSEDSQNLSISFPSTCSLDHLIPYVKSNARTSQIRRCIDDSFPSFEQPTNRLPTENRSHILTQIAYILVIRCYEQGYKSIPHWALNKAQPFLPCLWRRSLQASPNGWSLATDFSIQMLVFDD